MIKKINYEINYNNLILSAAIGYKWNNLKVFVKSLRNVSNDRVIFIVDKNIDKITKNNLDHYKIEYFTYTNKNLSKIFDKEKFISDVAQKRYEIYELILKKLIIKPKKILLTDSRDVVFQTNIFKYVFKKPLNFFLESERILNDSRNIKWLKRTVGKDEFEKIKNNFISCSGTTLGNYNEILNYTSLMIKYLFLFPYKRPFRHIIIFKKVQTGFDQGIHNYLIHNDFFKNKECHKNNFSRICTTAYMKNFKFNKKGQLINKKGKIYSLIHQYDRSFKKDGSEVFKFENIYE